MALAAGGGRAGGLATLVRIAGLGLRLTLPHLPNLLTGLRLLTALPLLLLLLDNRFAPAFVLLLGAVASDAIDGQLARWTESCSPLGAALDPIADKLLLAALYLGIADEGVVAHWLIGLILGRDLLLILAAFLVVSRGGVPVRRVEPLALGKLATAAQMGLGLVGLAVLAGEAAAAAVLPYAVPAVGILTVASFLAYALAFVVRTPAVNKIS